MVEASTAQRDDGALEIWCVVRCASSNDITNREQKTADFIDTEANEYLQQRLESREQMTPLLSHALSNGSVRAVRGDLGLKFLGIESKTLFRHISSHLSCIVHCGCHVNHIFDYATLKPTNVRSVDSLVEMCALVPEGKKPDFVYVSTISVLEDEAMSNEGPGSLDYIS